jgi:hypothetical protein
MITENDKSVHFYWTTDGKPGVMDAIAEALAKYGPLRDERDTLCAERDALRAERDALRARAEAAERDADAWRRVRNPVHKLDAEVRPGGKMDDDDVLDIVLRVLRDAARPARAAEAALAAAQAEGATTERAAVLRMLGEYRDHNELQGRTAWAAVLDEVRKDIEAGEHVRPMEGA